MKYEFLSPAWFGEVRKIRDSHEQLSHDLEELELEDLNFVINGEGGAPRTELCLRDGKFHQGRAPAADTEVRMSRRVARALLVDGDMSAALKAFVTGEITVVGDLSKLMSVAMDDTSGAGWSRGEELQARIREVTA